MRRSSVLALFALLAVLLLAVPAAADDVPAGADAADVVVLAVDGPPAGPEPHGRLDEGNAATELAGYGDRDVPFTWGAAWILTVTGVLGLAAGALFYRYRVKPFA